MADIVELKGNIFMVDLEECGCKKRTAGYFVSGKDGWLLVETGPASSACIIEEAAGQLGIKPEKLKYIAVTHIHLDHAGGLGVLAGRFKNAEIIVHPKGARHMIDPSRLVAGATKVFGNKKMEQYGEVLPVSKERIINIGEGDILDLGDRKIEVWEIPGHAKNHLCFYDTLTSGVFTGDAAGVYSTGLSELLHRPVIRPATPPPDFNGEIMIRSLARLALSGAQQLYFTHYGPAKDVKLLLESVLGQLVIYLELAKKLYNNNLEQNDLISKLGGEMVEYARGNLVGKKESLVELNLEVKQQLVFMEEMLKLSAAGIIFYLQKSNSL